MKINRLLTFLPLLLMLLFVGESRISALPPHSVSSRSSNVITTGLRYGHLSLLLAAFDPYDVDCQILTSYPEYSPIISYRCCPPPGVTGTCKTFSHKHAFQEAPDPLPPPEPWECQTEWVYWYNTGSPDYIDVYEPVDLNCWVIGQ
jgi:hypothetical protein